METAIKKNVGVSKNQTKSATGKFHISKVIIYLILILWGFTTIYPFLWVILNSFKESAEVFNNSFALPQSLNLVNYQNALDRTNIIKAYKNSLIISGSVMLCTMLLSTMMAFGMTRYVFKGRGVLDGIIAASLMFPVFATIIPVQEIMVRTGLSQSGSPIAVILPQIAGNLSFATIIMMGYLRGLPLEMEEAAYMEGANVWQVFGKIILPLCKSSLATVAIFCFLWSYNDMFTQITLIRRKANYPICALLNEISSKFGTDFGLMAASVTIIVVPVMIVYVLLQKNIIKGLTAGAVKG